MTRQTRGAVDAAMTYAMLQTDGNDKVIVLMTDGVPTCASGGAPAADDTRATVDVITWARNGGYRTFVVGIATAGGPGHDSLNMMGTAAGGVGFDGDGGGASYFAASSAAARCARWSTRRADARSSCRRRRTCTSRDPISSSSWATFTSRRTTRTWRGGTTWTRR
jgi:hypothetical protein